jgi:hypothetical protein
MSKSFIYSYATRVLLSLALLTCTGSALTLQRSDPDHNHRRKHRRHHKRHNDRFFRQRNRNRNSNRAKADSDSRAGAASLDKLVANPTSASTSNSTSAGTASSGNNTFTPTSFSGNNPATANAVIGNNTFVINNMLCLNCTSPTPTPSPSSMVVTGFAIVDQNTTLNDGDAVVFTRNPIQHGVTFTGTTAMIPNTGTYLLETTVTGNTEGVTEGTTLVSQEPIVFELVASSESGPSTTILGSTYASSKQTRDSAFIGGGTPSFNANGIVVADLTAGTGITLVNRSNRPVTLVSQGTSSSTDNPVSASLRITQIAPVLT